MPPAMVPRRTTAARIAAVLLVVAAGFALVWNPLPVRPVEGNGPLGHPRIQR